jgi:hypothetical protein
MGDWCRKADTEKPKEIPAKIKDVVNLTVAPTRRKHSCCLREVFALDRCLLIGDPFSVWIT